jgi:hypothetical protein
MLNIFVVNGTQEGDGEIQKLKDINSLKLYYSEFGAHKASARLITDGNTGIIKANSPIESARRSQHRPPERSHSGNSGA